LSQKNFGVIEMIDVFKKFFKPKEENINFSELGNWLDEHNSGLERIKERLKEIKSVKEELVENLKDLEKVDVSEAKVEDRVKTFVKGNLPAYVNAVNLFLKKIVAPDELNPVNLQIFCDSFESEFDGLNKRTFRNFQIIKEIIGKELEAVAKNVKKLDLLVKEIKKDTKSVKEIVDLKEKIIFIKNSSENKEKNKLRKEELEKEKKELDDSCKKLKKDIENLENGKKVKSLEKIKEKEKELGNKIKELDNDLTTLFSPFQKAFKKYNNIFFVKKVDDYINNPINTLLKDSEFEILRFLKDIKKMVEDGKIDLKDAKKKKLFENVEKLNQDFLKDFMDKRNSFNKELDSVCKEISSNTVRKEIEDLKKELNVKNFKIENIDREIDRLKDVDIMAEAEKLEKRLEEIFDSKIKIENVMG